MRPRLLKPLRDEPRERAERRRSERRTRSRRAQRRNSATDRQPSGEAPTVDRRPLMPAPPRAQSDTCDPAVEKVRRAGGPLDEAVYSCACGYLFSAAVSTTVSCPHCGTGQAW